MLTLVQPAPGRIFIVVTHLLGVGHLQRAALLAGALAREGHAVTLVSGGLPSPIASVEGLALVQLPPVRCMGTDFKTLLDEEGAPVTPERLAERRARLLAAFDAVQPDVVITELFPFGRRQLAEEFDALLERARAQRPRPAVLASVRDILNPPSRVKRVAEALARLGRSYDRVLVHGDPAVSRLWDSWPCAPSLAARLVDTGLVADRDRQEPAPAEDPGETGEILVSGGGSAAALPLFRASLDAARLLPDRGWRLLVGHGVPAEAYEAIRQDAPPHVEVERARADFPALLARAAVSVSQCGYNTMADVALTRVRAVVVPFGEGGEREQGMRAARLEAAGLVDVLDADALSGESLAAAVRAALSRPRPPLTDPRRPALPRVSLATNGAAISAAAVAEALQRARSRERALARAEAALDACGPIDVWWRDDDAVEDTPALQRLLALALAHGACPALAVIPATAEVSLAEALAAHVGISILQHGFAHANHAPEGQKKMELVARAPEALALMELETGLRRLSRLFGERALPVLVPPWNRIDPALLPLLPGLGFRGLSTFRARPRREAAPGLLAVNTHLDPIAWRQAGGLREPAELWDDLAGQLEARAAGGADATEPFGLLTHHLVHDEWVWAFLDDLLGLFAEHRSVHWRTAQVVFGGHNGVKPDG
jgi:predicted glycosyltransferase